MYIPASTSLNRSAIMRKERENSYKFDVKKKIITSLWSVIIC